MELPRAIPYAFRFRKESTALVIIDMQRDFLEPGGFGSIQCGDFEVFNRVRNIVPTVQRALETARKLGLHVMHTREGHLPDLSDLPASKRLRQTTAPNGHHTIGIGGPGPMGRLLVRGEYGHDVIDELRPLPGEVVIDKPGKGSFWKTGFHRALLARGITHLLLAGVTTECCVNTTAREAADRGFECCILSDCTSGFDAGLVTSANNTICAYDGLFGYVVVKDLSILALSQAYHTHTVTPMDTARIVAESISRYRSQNPDVWTDLRNPELLLDAAKTLHEKFAGEPLPPLYGIPFATSSHIGFESTRSHDEVVEALIDAGAIFVGSSSESRLAVAARLVSFSLETSTSRIPHVVDGQNGIVTLHPTPGTLTPDTNSLSIVAQCVEDARKIWLITDQTSNKDDVSLRPQATVNSWVWHVDFRGPRVGGFSFGVLKTWTDASGQSSTVDSGVSKSLGQAIAQLQAVGGQSLDVDWDVFGQAKQLSQYLLSLDSAESVSMKDVLSLQAEQKLLTRKAAKIFEKIDVVLDAACVSRSSKGFDSSLVDMLDLCGITIDLSPTHKQHEHSDTVITLLGGSGREGRLLDIARELEGEAQRRAQVVTQQLPS
ncbi:Isochorismatase hydrolase [Aureobasidium pullulans EXF-150]|uniref:Isochorismatase hydrolase n=1 Tax=Aureobasidium pullulans EXF-150 TaxID=1043002 RepID=A0A074XQ43_AURPU|nr:Isochorismatase hydrolase [Aureobasidium pullulans EXF-150]KEQ85789.1 Isochorismatase hydrolase [Aureobasidium pullulans EXF-150]